MSEQTPETPFKQPRISRRDAMLGILGLSTAAVVSGCTPEQPVSPRPEATTTSPEQQPSTDNELLAQPEALALITSLLENLREPEGWGGTDNCPEGAIICISATDRSKHEGLYLIKSILTVAEADNGVRVEVSQRRQDVVVGEADAEVAFSVVVTGVDAQSYLPRGFAELQKFMTVHKDDVRVEHSEVHYKQEDGDEVSVLMQLTGVDALELQTSYGETTTPSVFEEVAKQAMYRIDDKDAVQQV